jgi:hypothetical protein
MKKNQQVLDKKLAALKSNFVPLKEFEYKMEALSLKMADEKDYQA